MRQIIVLFLLITNLISFKSQGQTVIYSNKVEKDIFQIELYSDQTIQHQNLEKAVYWSLPSALFRFGLSDRIELQLVTPFTLEQIYNNNNIETNHYMNSTQVGVLINLIKQQNAIPEISFTYRSIIPFKENTVETISHLVSLNFSNKIYQDFNVNYNLKYKIIPETSDIKQVVINLGYNISSKSQLFIESSAELISDEIASNFITGGLSHTLRKNLYLNLYYGNCLKQNTSLAGGILTWRFNTKKVNS